MLAESRGVPLRGRLESPCLLNADVIRSARGSGREARRRSWRRAVLSCVAALALLAAASATASDDASPEPKRVLILESFSRDFSPFNQLSLALRAELIRLQGEPIEFLQVSIEAQSLPPVDEAAVLDYVRALCAPRSPDLVITTAVPAFQFYRKHRQQFLPGVPVLHGGADQSLFRGVTLSPDETAVTSWLDIPRFVENVLTVLPKTREVYLVFGTSPLERFWSAEFLRASEPLAPRVRVDGSAFAGLAYDEILRRAVALPPRSAIFFGLLARDAHGLSYQNERALERLSRAANAPVFTWSTAMVGRGAVGGRLVPIEVLAEEIGWVADRILRGEPPASIPMKTVPLSAPVYDARELARWGIAEKDLPPGSEVRYRPPTFLEQYRGRILLVAAVLVLQALAIGALLEGRRRQRRAEKEASRLRGELAHVGRVSVLGQLSSSLAHELSQPLGAILRNAEAAELFLAAETPDLAEVRSIVADIKADEHRAGNVIERMRGFLKHQEPKRSTLDPTALVEGVVTLVGPELQARGIRLETTVARELPAVTGDPVQLQQVLLNLLVNAMEAMEKTPRDARVLSVEIRAGEGGDLEIAVRDSGPGIPPGETPRIFEPFHTTKPAGLGMGLAISRTLVEAHGGRLRLEASERGGATFVVSLPSEGVPA